MKTFTFEALATDGSQVRGMLQAESSPQAVNKVQEQGLMPVRIRPKSAPIQENSPASPPAETTLERVNLHSYGWKIRLRKLLVFYIPFSLAAGAGFYLLLTGKPVWLVFAIGVGGLFLFGFIGSREEAKMLGSFACPRCRTSIEDWDTNANRRIVYNCGQCGVKWDIGYTLRSGGYG